MCYFLITFTFGDHIQARWALLPVVAGIMDGYCKEPTPDSRTANYQTIDTTVAGFNIGGAIGTLSLLLPLPRFAVPQLRQRLAAVYRQLMRWHAVLIAANLESENPRLLASASTSARGQPIADRDHFTACGVHYRASALICPFRNIDPRSSDYGDGSP